MTIWSGAQAAVPIELAPARRPVRWAGDDLAHHQIVLVTEGTYPHAHGGVSVWCDQLLRGLRERSFRVVALTAFDYQQPVWDLPMAVDDLLTVGLWDHKAGTGSSARPGRRRKVAPLASALAARLVAPTEDVAWFGGFLDRMSGLAPSTIAAQLSFPDLLAALDAVVRSPEAWDVVRSARTADLVVVADILDHLLRPLGVDPGPAAVYHASSNGLAALVCMVAARRHGRPFVLTEHGIYLRERYLELRRLALARPARALLLRFHRLVTATAYARATAVAPGSRWNIRWESRHGAPPDAVATIYNGVDPDELPGREVEPDEPVVAWLGRIDPIKDLETLVAAWATVHESRPDARLRLYGRTPPGSQDYRARLDRLVTDLGLGDVVSFEGGVARSADAYTDAQLGVLSSISEGFPYSLIEAMACGLPVVATGVGGVTEAVADTGLVVVPRSPELLGAAVVELLDDGPRRRQMGVAARARVLERFTLQICLDDYRDLYAKVVELPRVRLRAAPAWSTARSSSDGGDGSSEPATDLDAAQRDELVAALGGAEALSQAIDPDELAATLESVGVTDEIAQLRFESDDVFEVAERVWHGADRAAEPPRRVPPARPFPTGALWRGIACVLPAIVVAAAVLAGADQGALVAASVAAWGLGQGGGVLAFTATHRGASGATPDPGPLRLGLLVVTAAALAAGGVVAGLRSPAGGVAVALPLLYLTAATSLVVAGRVRLLVAALAPVAVLSAVVVILPTAAPSRLVGPAAVVTVGALLLGVGIWAWTGRRARGVLQAADWAAGLLFAGCGWCSAMFALLTVCAVGQLPELAPSDSRQWLLLASPLWAVVAGSEWRILAVRQALAAKLESRHSLAGFRRAAVGLVARDVAVGLVAVTAASVAGAVGAHVLAGVPLLAAGTATAIFAAVAAALHGTTVLAATARPQAVLVVMAIAGALLAGLALTTHAPLGLPDPQVALVVAGMAAVVLCGAAGRALVDPASHR